MMWKLNHKSAFACLNAIIFIVGCAFHNAPATTRLSLGNRNLTKIPDSVFQLSKLEYLQLGNSFTLYPPLSALGKDSLPDMNTIRRIPDDINRLTHLRTLGCCFNDLVSLSRTITQLNHLDTLILSFNQHLKIEQELLTLKQMHSLKYLELIETECDQKTLHELRLALPNTKIVDTYDF
jgi:Leucine-rich repeat (LRR) protein